MIMSAAEPFAKSKTGIRVIIVGAGMEAFIREILIQFVYQRQASEDSQQP